MSLYWEVFIAVVEETVTRMVNSCKILFHSTSHYRLATDNELGKPEEVISHVGKHTFYYTPFFKYVLVVL